MPIISKFYGIIIRMACLRQFEARLYATYGNSELVVGLWPLKILHGEAPRRVREMVLEWAAAHQQELLASWNKLQWGQPPITVEPLQ